MNGWVLLERGQAGYTELGSLPDLEALMKEAAVMGITGWSVWLDGYGLRFISAAAAGRIYVITGAYSAGSTDHG